jgi:hypothetical protein
VAIVRKDPALTKEQVLAHCKQNLTGYKVPKVVEFWKELPKTNVGKVLRREVKNAPLQASGTYDMSMYIEKIKVKAEDGKILEVVGSAEAPGAHPGGPGRGRAQREVQPDPHAQRARLAGSVMGREIVYERSREQVQADLDRLSGRPGRTNARSAQHQLLQDVGAPSPAHRAAVGVALVLGRHRAGHARRDCHRLLDAIEGRPVRIGDGEVEVGILRIGARGCRRWPRW